MVGKAVAFEFGLAEDVVSNLDLAPEIVDPQGQSGEKHVDNVDAEQASSRSMKAKLPYLVGLRFRFGRGGGDALTSTGWVLFHGVPLLQSIGLNRRSIQ